MEILKENEAERVLEKHGFPVVPRFIITKKSQLFISAEKLGFPIAMKNPSFLHKTEKNAVLLNVTKETLLENYNSLHSRRIIIQKQLNGIELLVGLKKDPTFGYIIACGSGGIFTEIIKDMVFRVCPITKKDAQSMLAELRVYPILSGFRSKLYPIKKIIIFLVKLSSLPNKHPEIQEMDINPLIIDEKDIAVADARITSVKKMVCTSQCQKT